ncbi:MAG TPA: hypothetical protein VNM24_06945 [Burkholderiales bacterium]|nr:hypothetical protein [Burkholderiales bacterium]
MLSVFLRWLGFSAVLHLVWEIAQLPLYTIYREGDLATIAFAVGHCTAGDLLISAATYLAAGLVARSGGWPLERPGTGLAAAVAVGMAYTAFSEWLNVSVRGSWEYAPAMPQLFGIGLAPLFQWLAIPTLTLFAVRRTKLGRLI